MLLTENTGHKKSPSAHHHTILVGYIFGTLNSCIDNWKKLIKQKYPTHVLAIWWTSSQ